MDDGSPVDVIYLDFQKAFDKVPHQRLISKLKSHGMGNSLINWLEQWPDTPQFLGGNPYFFCENLYQSVSFVDALMYRDIFHAIRIAKQFAKNRDNTNTNRQLLGATELKIGLVEIGALRHVDEISRFPEI